VSPNALLDEAESLDQVELFVLGLSTAVLSLVEPSLDFLDHACVG